MRRIILHMMISLDGFVAPRDGTESWMTSPDPDREAASLALVHEVDTAMAGHGVYADMVAYWPGAQGGTATQRDYIDRVNAMPKLIVSRRPAELSWNNASSFVSTSEADLVNRIRALKRGPGRDIVFWGGADIAQQFARLDLIDEYQLMVQPIVLGGGEALFAGLDHWTTFRLVACRPVESGAVLMTYAPADGGADRGGGHE
ncbi:MAG: dihydrofolate reductase family protein [Pseudonocardia sp.]|nr:dihydrofolate reductase family protein [Pseudonocardia sp.]